MTIGSWILFGILAFFILGIGLMFMIMEDSKISFPISIVITILILIGMLWYYGNTASGQRALVDEKSELNNGIERVINVYTANGDMIASYEGKIDIDTNDGGYVKFDFQGKRYIYYNCFIETIADID